MISDVSEFKTPIKFFDKEGQFNSLKILLIGKSGCGKSVILKDLLIQLKERYEAGIVVSATEMDGKPFYANFIPRHLIYGLQNAKKPGFFD